jgi:hypothetical protein
MVFLGQETPAEHGGAIDLWCPVVIARVPDYWPVDGSAIRRSLGPLVGKRRVES